MKVIEMKGENRYHSPTTLRSRSTAIRPRSRGKPLSKWEIPPQSSWPGNELPPKSSAPTEKKHGAMPSMPPPKVLVKYLPISHSRIPRTKSP